MNYWTQSEKNIFVAAHRGWSEKYPENTMLAFEKALEIGVDQIELDVRVTKDNELVIIHDAAVDRTTDGTGLVNSFTLQELQQLDAGIKKGEQFKGTRIPTLIEFMELVKDHPTITVDFELKEYPVNGNEEVAYSVCDLVLAIIRQYGFEDRCVINTFDAKLHEYIRDTYNGAFKQHVYFPLSCMGQVKDDPYTYGYCVCMFGDGDIIAPKEECDKMKARGVRPWAGAGVKTSAGVDQVIAKGCELITCNNPDEILQFLRDKGYHK